MIFYEYDPVPESALKILLDCGVDRLPINTKYIAKKLESWLYHTARQVTRCLAADVSQMHGAVTGLLCVPRRVR